MSTVTSVHYIIRYVFFSSRRRHTRSKRDWSSDVCSSDLIQKGVNSNIPLHLKDSHYPGADKMKKGAVYKYPHNYQNGWVKQQYLPDSLKGRSYYDPKATGKFEQAIKQVYDKIQNDK